MNYKEKLEKEIHDTISEMEKNLTKLVKDWVVESYKNGIETGKNVKKVSNGSPRTFFRKFKTELGKDRNAAVQTAA